MLRDVSWQMVTDVSGKHIGPTVKVTQSACKQGKPSTSLRRAQSYKREDLNYTTDQPLDLAQKCNSIVCQIPPPPIFERAFFMEGS